MSEKPKKLPTLADKLTALVAFGTFVVCIILGGIVYINDDTIRPVCAFLGIAGLTLAMVKVFENYEDNQDDDDDNDKYKGGLR